MSKEIQKVSSGKEKEEVFRKYMGKYKKAMKYNIQSGGNYASKT